MSAVGAGIFAEALPAGDEARQVWRSGQNRSALQADKAILGTARGASLSYSAKVKVTVKVTFIFLLSAKSSNLSDEGAGIFAEALPAGDEARQVWRSGQNRSALQADKAILGTARGASLSYSAKVK